MHGPSKKQKTLRPPKSSANLGGGLNEPREHQCPRGWAQNEMLTRVSELA